jgi:hypothetical protein
MGHHDERRRLPRRRTRLSAAAVFGPNDAVVACTVRDKTETGARLLIDNRASVPDEFHLIELTTGELHRAQVVWRDDAFVGVTLHDSVMLSASKSPQHRRFADLRARLTAKTGLRLIS